VPLVIYAPDLFTPRTVSDPVQTVDLLPTVLAALEVPQPPRVRGRNLASLMLGSTKTDGGLALAESEDQVMLAQGSFRLICQRQLGACRLFDVTTDPAEQIDLSSTQTERFERMRRKEQELSASHGQYETQGLRAEGKGWPNAILRGVAGDGDSAEEVAALLDDADSSIRRKAAELLFELNRTSATTALRLALTRDEDPVVRSWCALALTRAGQGAPLVYDLLSGHDVRFSRLAALALADAGDSRGVEQLVGWWRDEPSRSYQQSRWLLTAFSRLRAKSAVPALVRNLGDVRLRPHIAAALADIGDGTAREPLARAFAEERYQNARVAIAKALVQLHAREEMARPLLRFLGVPDPIPGGLGLAQAAKVLQYVGGPEPKELARLTKNANFGTRFSLVIPKIFGNQLHGLRLIVKVSNQGSGVGEVRVLPVRGGVSISSNNQTLATRNFDTNELAPLIIPVPEKVEAAELHRPVPRDFHWGQGNSINIDLLATSGVRVEALAVVPLAEELPLPPPQPWMPDREPAQSIE
jgi:HEAT repeat protein